MNEQIQKEFLEWMKAISNNAEQAKNFTLEQAPHLAQDIVRYGQAYYTICMILSVILFIAGVRVLLGSDWKNLLENCNYPPINGFGVFLRILFIAISLAVSTVTILVCLNTTIMVWFAPRLYLINYIKEITNGIQGK